MTRDGTATRDWELWSTSCRLVVTDAAALDLASAVVDAELARVEQAASRFRRDSELMTLDRGRSGSVELSPVLADLMRAALDAAARTDGAVDPTLGSVLAGLGYDRDIAEVRARVGATPVRIVRHGAGWRSLWLEGSRLHLPPGVQLDLGATAKAVAADRCAQLVHEKVGTGVLVGLGGDIATAGPAPEGGWQVRVQDLPSDVPQQITLYAGAAVATSSTVKRTWDQAGEHRHHLVDPLTLQPVTSPWRSVTVVAPSCLVANTATTATLVKGPRGLAWLRGTGLPSRLLARHGGPVTVGGWPRDVAA